MNGIKMESPAKLFLDEKHIFLRGFIPFHELLCISKGAEVNMVMI